MSISKAVKFGILFSIPAFFGILIFSNEIISFCSSGGRLNIQMWD